MLIQLSTVDINTYDRREYCLILVYEWRSHTTQSDIQYKYYAYIIASDRKDGKSFRAHPL